MKSMGSTRSAVEAVGDGIEFVLTVDREVSALWQVLTQQPVSVLTGSLLRGQRWDWSKSSSEPDGLAVLVLERARRRVGLEWSLATVAAGVGWLPDGVCDS